MSRHHDIKEWNALHANPPENWRAVWETRDKITNRESRDAAERYIDKHQASYSKPLHIDLHVKDGYVVYTEREIPMTTPVKKTFIVTAKETRDAQVFLAPTDFSFDMDNFGSYDAEHEDHWRDCGGDAVIGILSTDDNVTTKEEAAAYFGEAHQCRPDTFHVIEISGAIVE